MMMTELILVTLTALFLAITGIISGFIAYRDGWKRSVRINLDILTVVSLLVTLIGVLIIFG